MHLRTPVLLLLLLGGCSQSSRRPAADTPPGTPEDLPATVSQRVSGATAVDGDTLRLPGGETVRYLGIDAPEQGQPFHVEATRRNQQLIQGRPVELEREHTDRDRYGRLLRHVWVRQEDGTRVMVEEILVREGLARATPYPPDVAREEQLRRAEEEAHDQGRGLWVVTPDAPFYVGSTRTFHRAGCRNIARIRSPVRFNTRAEAARSGLRPARCCNP